MIALPLYIQNKKLVKHGYRLKVPIGETYRRDYEIGTQDKLNVNLRTKEGKAYRFPQCNLSRVVIPVLLRRRSIIIRETWRCGVLSTKKRFCRGMRLYAPR